MAENLGTLGTAFIDIVARQDALDNSFNSLQNKARSFANALGVTLGAAGILQGFKAIVGAASDFEKTFTGVRKTVDASEPEFAAMSQQIRNLSKTIPVAVTELNNIAEAGGQLGISKHHIVDFTDTIARLAATTNLSSEQAATSIAQFINVMGTSQNEIRNIGSAISGLGNISAATETDIVQMAQRLAAAGHQIGLTESQVLGFATSLSEVGIQAEAGGTAFSKLFIEMATSVATGSDALDDFAKVALPGVTGATEKFAKMFREDAAGAVVAFISGLDKTHMSGEQALLTLQELGITEARMTNAILSTASASARLNTNMENSARLYKENNATLKESERAFATFDSKVTLLKSSMNDLAIDIGNKLLPVLAKGVGALSDLISQAQQGEGPLVNLAGAIALVGTALAIQKLLGWADALKLVIIQAGASKTALSALDVAMGLSTTATWSFTAALGALKAALLAAAPPVALIAGLAVVAYKTYEIGNAIHLKEEAQLGATQAENAAWNSTMRAINTLKQHNIVINTQGKSLADLQIEIGKYSKELATSMKAESDAAKAAEKAAVEKAKAAVALSQKNEELSKKEKERLADLRAEFMDSLKPADELNRRIADLGKGFSDVDVVKVYGDEIIEAAAAQKEHGYAVTGATAKLLTMAQMFKLNKELLSSLNDEVKDFKLPEIDLSQLLPKIDFGDPNMGIPPPVPPKFGQMAYDATKKLENMKKEVLETADAVKQLSKDGYSGAQIQKLLGSELDNAAKFAKEFGYSLDPAIQALIDQKEAAEKSKEEAIEWQKVWTTAMGNLVTDFVRGISDIVFKGQSIGKTFKDIGLQAGKSFFDAFLLQVTKPITKMFNDWGASLAKSLTGGLTSKITGGLSNLLGLGGAGAAAGVGAGAAGAGAGAGAAGAGAGAGGGASGGGIAALASNPITIAAAAAVVGALLIKKFVGQGREKADEFVQGVQNPFGTQLSNIVDKFDEAKRAGTLTAKEAEDARIALAQLVDSFMAAGADFAKKGSNQQKVWQQAVDTMTTNFGVGFSNIFDSWDQTISMLKQKEAENPDTADGEAGVDTGPRVVSGIPATGLATSASQIFAAAVDKFVSAVESVGGAAPGSGGIVIEMPISIQNTFELDGDFDPITIRDRILPEIDEVIETGIRGYTEKWAKKFRDSLGGATSQQTATA